MSTCNVSLCPIKLAGLADSQPKSLQLIPHPLKFALHPLNLGLLILVLCDYLSDSFLLFLQLTLQLLPAGFCHGFFTFELAIPLCQCLSKTFFAGLQVKDLGLKVT